jgi:2-oxo-4-hydroxy-4-carboxy-5-ureidoimidazoline decarboxylase
MPGRTKASPKCWRPAIPSGRNATWTTTKKRFTHHPRIGDVESLSKKYANTKAGRWGAERCGNADRAVIEKLAEGNKTYEEKFGYIFIVNATGKSASEMLALLEAE